MELIDFDNSLMRDRSIKRTIDQLYNTFFDQTSEQSFQVISLDEYYLLPEQNNIVSMRSTIEIVPSLYKNHFNPDNETYARFRSTYLKRLVYDFLFNQNSDIKDYNIDIKNKTLLPPKATTGYDEMQSNKWKLNGNEIYKEEGIKYLFQYYFDDIHDLVEDLSKEQPKRFETIKVVAIRNIQPDDLPLFMNLVITNYKRLIELFKAYNEEDIKHRKDIEELIQARNELISKVSKIDEELGTTSEKGKTKILSSGQASAKLYMYDEKQGGFMQTLLFIFLVGLTSGLSFFVIASVVRFILNRI